MPIADQEYIANKEFNKRAILRLIVGGSVAMFGYVIWQGANDSGWIPHDTLAIVSAKGWSTGEYKTCTEPNIAGMQEEPQIDCSGIGADSELKRFKVRFYGATYKEELKDRVDFVWRCRKNEGTDPMFTCDDQKIMQRDKK